MNTMDNLGNLTASLRDLYTTLTKTTEGFPPIVFLQVINIRLHQKLKAHKVLLNYLLDVPPSLSPLCPNWSGRSAHAARCRRMLE